VLESGTGEGAITLLNAHPQVDVLFTDIQLAGYLSGWDVAEAFREKRLNGLVLYASGNSIDARRQVPGSRFFRKPYTSAAIIDACRLLR
jgi:CheY-like chemotaxis protein